MSEEKKILKPIWLWWVILTVIYVVLYETFITGITVGSLMAYVTGFIGLFVPFGPLSFFWAVSTFPFSLISFAVFFGGAYFFQKWLSRKNFNAITTIFLVLFALFVLTFLTDIARGLPFAGFRIFLKGDFRVE